MSRKQRKTAHRTTPLARADAVAKRASTLTAAVAELPPDDSVKIGTTLPDGAAVAPAGGASSETNSVELILEIYRYRHLLRNLRLLHEQRKREERETAPSVKGPRVAAVLARLWATEDLGLPSASQKVIGVDLGIAPSEIGKMLKLLRSEK